MPTSALLVMDVQTGIVRRFADTSDYLPRLRRAIDAARSAGIPVIYVQVDFREGYPEVSEHNKSFSALKQRGGFTGAVIHPDVAMQPDDVLVTKRRISAFTGSDLDVVLRAAQIDTLVLTGISTSGVVLSTLRQAADLDFRLTVLSDGCLDSDEEVHQVLMEKIFPRQAEVVTIAEWIEQTR